jgi:hypothetical protein
METLIKTMQEFDLSVFGYVTQETIIFINRLNSMQ